MGKSFNIAIILILMKTKIQTEDAYRRVVEENIQKLFIAQLRLPPLSIEEKMEFLSRTIDYSPEIGSSDDHATPNDQRVRNNNSNADGDIENEAENLKNNNNQDNLDSSSRHNFSIKNKSAEIELSSGEKLALARAIKRLASKERSLGYAWAKSNS